MTGPNLRELQRANLKHRVTRLMQARRTKEWVPGTGQVGKQLPWRRNVRYNGIERWTGVTPVHLSIGVAVLPRHRAYPEEM